MGVVANASAAIPVAKGKYKKFIAKHGGIVKQFHRFKWTVAGLGTAINRLVRYPNAFGMKAVLSQYTGAAQNANGSWSFNFGGNAQPNYTGMLSFAVDDLVKRRVTHHYQRIASKHLLPAASEAFVALDALWCGSSSQVSGGGAFLPQNVDWVGALACYQDSLTGYNPDIGTYDMSRRFKSQLAVTYASDIISWGASKVGLNRHLPKGVKL